MTTLSLDSLTTDPIGSENGLVTRNIPSGTQMVEVTDGYGNILGTSTNPINIVSTTPTRTPITYFNNGYSLSNTEVMVSLTPTSNYISGTSASSFQADSGTTLRILSINISNVSKCNLRISNSGTVSTSTLLVTPLSTGLNTFPEGIELSGSMQFGISASGFNETLVIYIIGYEH